MRVKSLGKNITEIETGKGYILVSYQTPVACIIHDDMSLNKGYTRGYRTNEFHSVTTSRHINQWLQSYGYNPTNVITKEQGYFDQLLD